MTKLSNTDRENLERLIDAGGATNDLGLKGQMIGWKKLIDAGLMTKHAWKGGYIYQITAAGREAARA